LCPQTKKIQKKNKRETAASKTRPTNTNMLYFHELELKRGFFSKSLPARSEDANTRHHSPGMVAAIHAIRQSDMAAIAMASGEANTCKCGPLRFTIVTTNPQPGTTARLDGNDGKGTSTMAKVSPKTNQPLLFVLIFF
jgi:hypothetical protein